MSSRNNLKYAFLVRKKIVFLEQVWLERELSTRRCYSETACSDRLINREKLPTLKSLSNALASSKFQIST